MLPLAAADTPAWLAFGGALLVALIAAGTAQWRQREQLTHDRQLRDLEELRDVFDECARMAGDASQLLLFMLNRSRGLPRVDSPMDAAARGRPLLLRELGVNLEISEPAYSSTDAEFRALEDAFYKTASPVFGLYQRLVLRLGRENKISAAFLELQLQWVALGISALLAETDANSEGRDIGIAQIQVELRSAHFGFLEAARLQVGSEVPHTKA